MSPAVLASDQKFRAKPRAGLGLRYAIIAFIFLVAVAYQTRLSVDIVRGFSVSVPYINPETASNEQRIVRPEAAALGLHPGDQLLAVNGKPYTGTAALWDAVTHTPPGSSFQITVRPKGTADEQTISIPIARAEKSLGEKMFYILLCMVMPAICILMGCWAVLARPHDHLAWLLLGLLLCFPHLLEAPTIPSWGPGVREVAMFYHMTLIAGWPIFMYLFGFYFPERFPKDEWWLGKVPPWIVLVPLALFGAIDVIASITEMSNYSIFSGLYRVMDPFSTFLKIYTFCVVGMFFAFISTKAYLPTTSLDSRRRLKLLYYGTTLAMTPALLIIIYAAFRHQFVYEAVPEWLISSTLLLLMLFPLTLAYVIVVQRAMDVRVVVRQGLQYAFAKNGIRVLQVLVTMAVVFTAAALASESTRNRPQKITVIALGVTAVFSIRTISDKLRSWTDRKFFNEAYNAEQVLSELSDSVRGFVETTPLIETVAARISETLHVPRVAVLLGLGGRFRPAYALGYGSLPDVSFPAGAGPMKLLREQREPARVYLDDPESWVYRDAIVTDEDRRKFESLDSELLLPLSARDQLLGFISLGPKLSDEPYSGTDVRLLKSVAAQTGLALENARLMSAMAEEVAQRERLNREVEIAREVQERLFPQKLPTIEGVEFCGTCRPALGVGGDYYDFLALPEGHLGIAIGDVSGKGIAAALMMASLQASLRGEATRAPENLAGLIANVNRLVYEASSSNRYATFFYAQYNPSTRLLTYVNAGHNPPMLFHREGEKWQVTRLEIGGTVVGLLESFPYEQASLPIAPGDILVAFTDGISEAMNNADEEWGEDQLMRTIETCDALSTPQIIERVMIAADAFVNGAKQHDDMTLVVVRSLPT